MPPAVTPPKLPQKRAAPLSEPEYEGQHLKYKQDTPSRGILSENWGSLPLPQKNGSKIS